MIFITLPDQIIPRTLNFLKAHSQTNVIYPNLYHVYTRKVKTISFTIYATKANKDKQSTIGVTKANKDKQSTIGVTVSGGDTPFWLGFKQ